MTPRETTDLALQFTASASPWWLVLLVPAAVGVGWLLYRVDLPGLGRAQSIGLVGLRCLLLAGLVLLAFRPNLIHRRTLTYPGRVVFVVDDSLSMTTPDPQTPAAVALRLARSLDPTSPEADAPPEPLCVMAGQLEEVVRRLRAFQRDARDADRSLDAFWVQAEAAQGELTAKLDRIDELATQAAALLEDRDDELDEALAEAAAVRAGLATFFTGRDAPAPDAYREFYARADAVAERLLAFQAHLDERRLAAGSKPLRRRADDIRQSTRLELVRKKLARLAPRLDDLVPDQGFELVSLTSGEAAPIDGDTPPSLEPRPGETDLVGRLEAVLDAESDFPLSAIVLVSDGRDVVGRPIAALGRALSQKQVPVLSAGVGRPTEPTDVAVVELVAPPIAVAGAETTVRAKLKVALDAARTVRIELLRETEPVATHEVELTPADAQWIELPLAPDEPGVFGYTLRVEPLPGEVFPAANNAADFVLHVREQKLSVLLLDFAPRWETRFALNVLERLPYVELSGIVVLSQPEGKLVRGAERGTWPESPAALEMYDLVVLGDLPPHLLNEAEWAALGEWVEEKGGTLCLLAPRGRHAAGTPPPEPGLWPLEPPAADARAVELKRGDELRLTPAGCIHPLTAALSADLGSTDRASSPEIRPTAQVLMTGPDATRPLLTWQLLGEGKVLLLDAERLWMPLNPTARRGHLELFVGLVTWAVEGGWAERPDENIDEDTAPPENDAGPRLALGRRRLVAGQPIEVIAAGGRTTAFQGRRGEDPGNRRPWKAVVPPAGTVIEAFVAGEKVAESTAEPLHDGASLCGAVFADLPHGEVVFRLRDDPDVPAPPFRVVARQPELDFLALDERRLKALAETSGGAYRGMDRLERLLLEVEPQERIERRERLWRLWDGPYVMALLVVILSVEWVWRKLAGRV